MDFSVPGSDVWESTSTQECFIENFFNHKETLSSIEQKGKTVTSKKKFPQPKSKKLKLNKKIKLKSSKDPECPTEEIPSPVIKLKRKKTMKSVHSENFSGYEKKSQHKKIQLKSSKHPDCPTEEIPSPIIKLKRKKTMKSNVHSENFSGDENKSQLPKLKKLKLDKNIKHPKCSTKEIIPSTTKKLKRESTLKSDLHVESFSGDESDDEEIISDIRNSSIFKQIQKLMKENSSLQNYKDSDEESVGEVSASCSDSDLSESNLLETKGNDLKKNGNLKVGQKGPAVKSITLANEPSIAENNSSFPILNKYNFPRSDKSCDFPRNSLKNSSDSTKVDSLDKNKEKLQGAKFRHLNEKLYTETGTNAFEYFQKNQEEYEEYHKGFSIQVSKWPMNPVDKILSDLKHIGKDAVIADMGCGDAKIARTLTKATVHSFDIVALNEHVTSCNISKVPLAKESVDVVVFCLSLMGTNLNEYILEAHRILKKGGTLKIAEVESRIEDINAFIRKLKILGFSIKNKDLKHRMFVFLDFQKVKRKIKKDKLPKSFSLSLRPCLYKKR